MKGKQIDKAIKSLGNRITKLNWTYNGFKPSESEVGNAFLWRKTIRKNSAYVTLRCYINIIDPYDEEEASLSLDPFPIFIGQDGGLITSMSGNKHWFTLHIESSKLYKHLVREFMEAFGNSYVVIGIESLEDVERASNTLDKVLGLEGLKVLGLTTRESVIRVRMNRI